MARGQAERLIPLLEDVLRDGGARWRDLGALAVGVGPGNFTGIRISIAAARGLGLGLGCPTLGVSSFEARAHGLARPLVVAEDARRDQVYLQSFTPDPGPPRLVNLAELHAIDAPQVTGNAAVAVAQRTGATVLEAVYPLALAIAHVGQMRAGQPNPRPAALYIRSADAAAPAARPPVLLP